MSLLGFSVALGAAGWVLKC
ncbi:MAG: hypothetical protein DCF15_07985 [Phormidesmis priestleyi]|uniref:Uncharacterized protein n=1 Tax=Phormidesmis priestleyi TaxID=268141 RepID=A0A2W4XL78_9CYAN|nr:MAG: hypothetical protein DCF15_07985 [Phormidesmis priestleyi]